MSAATTADIVYSVDVSDGNARLCVTIRGRTIPVPISADQAAALAPSLLTASAMSGVGNRPFAGPTTVQRADLPVVAWQTGAIPNAQLPVLIVDVRGGARLAFQFSPEMASRCGRSLMETGLVFL